MEKDNRRKVKTRIRRKNAGFKKVTFWLIILILVITIFIKGIVPATVTASRYVYKAVKNFYFNSKEFYFNSDKLSEDTAVFEADNWSGVDAYPVIFNINCKKNAIEYSKVDITYNIKYTLELHHNNGSLYSPSEYENDLHFVIAGVSKEDYNPITGIVKTLTADSNSTNIEFNVSKTGNLKLLDGDYIFIRITAESMSPYKKTIDGTFKITVGNLGMSYQIDDTTDENTYSPYCTLILTNTLDYYIVDTAFGDYQVGDQISVSDYEDAGKPADKCHSMVLDISFNPNDLLLDTTSVEYLNTLNGINIPATNQVVQKQVDDGAGNLVTRNFYYVNGMRVSLSAEESKSLKFYKVDSSQNYKYPNGTNSSIINVHNIYE